MENKYWKPASRKLRKSKNNNEIVTLRAFHYNAHSTRITISIGMLVCDLIELKKGDLIGVYLHKLNRDLLLVTKNKKNNDYTLSHNGSSNFMSTTITLPFCREIKVSQTVRSKFDFNKNKDLIIDMSKLKWEK